jgi:hypothetical protein
LVYCKAAAREGKNGTYTNPLADCFDYAKVCITEPVALGCSSKDAMYKDRFQKYFDNIRRGVIDAPIFQQQDDLSATDFRNALVMNEPINSFLPDHVNEEEISELFKAQ